MKIEKETIRERQMKELAPWYLGLPALEGERDINQDDAIQMGADMIGEKFLYDTQPIATVEVDGKTYRLNGQTRCHAWILLNDKAPDVRMRHCHYVVPTMRDAVEMYASYDRPGSSRKYHHVAGMVWREAGLRDDYQMKLLCLVAAAASFDKGGCLIYAKSKIKGRARMELAIEYSKFLRPIRDVMGAQNSNPHMWREAVVCAILQTHKVARGASQDFWTKVRSGEMLRDGEPASCLRNWLLINRGNSGHGERAGPRHQAGFKEIYTKCIHAWNAFRRDDTTALKYYAKSEMPKAI